MKKLIAVVLSLVVMIGGATVASQTAKIEDIGKGIEVIHVTDENRKSDLVKFPEAAFDNDDLFAESLFYALGKLYGEEFCPKCKVVATRDDTQGVTILTMRTDSWYLIIKPLINNREERKVVGVEIIPKKLTVDL